MRQGATISAATIGPRQFLMADLMCGAGGTSKGAQLALQRLRLAVTLTVLNHWARAIATHTANFPEARHHCEDIAAARPHILVPEGYLDLLCASPTCTYHSAARGGKPTSDQQRSDPWHIVTWLTELRVARLVIENVPEFVNWGPVDPITGKPIKERRGEYFRTWIETMRALGFQLEWRILNAADYGAATTRRRFFLIGRSDGGPLVWPTPTHFKRKDGELFTHGKPWRAAREIIDWEIRGRSIFGRKIPLAPKTLDRVLAGTIKFKWPAGFIRRLEPEIERSLLHVIRRDFPRRNAEMTAKDEKSLRKRITDAVRRLRTLREYPVSPSYVGSDTADAMLVTMRNNADGRSVEDPTPGVLANGQHLGIADPIFINGRKGNEAKEVSSDPIPTLDTKGGVWLAEPFMLSRQGGGAPREVDLPTPSQVAKHSHLLIAPYYGGGSGETCSSGDEPLPTATTKARFGIVMPVTHDDKSDRARSVEHDPIPGISGANRGDLAFITAAFGEREGQAPRIHDIAVPSPTICAEGRINLVEPTEDYDILFRMLKWWELGGAMGFGREYQFTGNETEIVKQIGNAVSVEQAEALIYALCADAAEQDDEPEPVRRAAE
jgi:DNA (cytosine-5)-methyltransferase 1